MAKKFARLFFLLLFCSAPFNSFSAETVTSPTPSTAPPPALEPRPEISALLDSLEALNYTVQAGDSLHKIARHHKTTIELLKNLNRLPGDAIHTGMILKAPSGSFAVEVDKSDNVLTLFYDHRVVKRYPVATGAGDKTPVGDFKVVNKLENPTWYKAGAIVPPGSPDNTLGTRWLGLDVTGYGIHGTTDPESIGKHVTSGCVRMQNEEAEELYSLLPMGTPVKIAD